MRAFYLSPSDTAVEGRSTLNSETGIPTYNSLILKTSRFLKCSTATKYLCLSFYSIGRSPRRWFGFSLNVLLPRCILN